MNILACVTKVSLLLKPFLSEYANIFPLSLVAYYTLILIKAAKGVAIARVL